MEWEDCKKEFLFGVWMLRMAAFEMRYRLLLWFSVLSVVVAVVCGGNVTYDGRSLIINGERKLLFSGSIHYPRSTPEVLFYISWKSDHSVFVLDTRYLSFIFFGKTRIRLSFLSSKISRSECWKQKKCEQIIKWILEPFRNRMPTLKWK